MPAFPVAVSAPPLLTEARAAEIILRAAREQARDKISKVSVHFRPFRATLFSFKISVAGVARVKFHVAFRRASEPVLLQAGCLMFSRRRRGKKLAVARNAYDAFVRAIPPAEFELPGARRGRRQALAPQGKHYSLEESFQRVNREYFRGQLARPELCWSPARARRMLGSYHERNDRLIISRIFDSPSVPEQVLDYLMYHELLHKHLGIGRRADGKRSVHGASFRRLEKCFRHYQAAQNFLKQKR